MNRTRSAALVVGVSLGWLWWSSAGPALGADPKPGGAPPAPALAPAKELDQLRYFLGTWKCAGKALAGPGGAEHPVTGVASSKLEADGFWASFVYEERRSKDHPGLRVTGLWGWDVAGKRFVRAAGNNQGVWDNATSIGWSGDLFTWTGEFAGPMGHAPFRQVFTRRSDKEWSHRLEINPQGTWIPMTEVSCTRGK